MPGKNYRKVSQLKIGLGILNPLLKVYVFFTGFKQIDNFDFVLGTSSFFTPLFSISLWYLYWSSILYGTLFSYVYFE